MNKAQTKHKMVSEEAARTDKRNDNHTERIIHVTLSQFQFGGFNMMFPDASRPFNNSYKCFSVSMFPGNDRQDVEKGGKSE